MTVRGKLIGMCACVAAIQLGAAAGHGWFSRRASEHHAGTRGAHEQLELLVQIEAGLVWQLKELGDLALQRGRPAEGLNIDELLAAQKRVDEALEQFAERARAERQSREEEDVEGELANHAALAALIADLRAGVVGLAQAVRSRAVDRDVNRSMLESRVGLAIERLHAMVESEKEEVVEQEDEAAEAAAWSGRVAWSAPLVCAMVLMTALGLVLRSIAGALSDLARGASRVAGGDLDSPVPVRSQDELGRLATAFNDMQLDLRRRIEERDSALRDARFRTVSEAAPVAIAEVDGAGRMLYVNRRWLELTGSGPGSSSPWTDLVQVDDRLRVTRLQLDDGGAPEEVRVVRGDAAVWVSAQMARLDGDAADRHIVALADITAQKKAIARAEQLSRELMTVSRKAGMAEISAGVLHNVGNVLSSVLVSATTLGEVLRQSRVSGLVKAAGMLDERRDDLAAFLSTDRGKLVVPYLVQVAAHIVEEMESAQNDLTRIEKGIEHIRAIVTSQQSYAKSGALSEQLRLSEVLDDVLKLNSSRFDKHEVRIVRRLEADPPLVTDRHKAMQILINLISNALHAVKGVERSDVEARVENSITITMRSTSAGNLAVEVADTGVGIAPENLARIFEYGFTTRKEGHGFGLHSSALTAQELGGRLRVTSEGVGRGAAFTLELPVPAVGQAARSA